MADKNRVLTIKNMFLPESVDDAMAEYLLTKCYEIIEDTHNPTDKPPRTEVTENLRKYFNLDFRQIEPVMDYAYGKSQDRDKANDYAVAQHLNDRADIMVSLVYDAIKQAYNGLARPDITKINKAYVLIVEEMKILTNRSPQLRAIEAKAIWQRFDTLKGYDAEIYTYFEPFSQSEDIEVYANKVDRLCIISNAEKPQYTKTQERLMADADEAIRIYRNSIKKAQEINDDQRTDWLIPDYKLTHEGKKYLKINGIDIKKTNAGAVDDILVSAFNNDGKGVFTPDIGSTERKLTSNVADIFNGKIFTKDEQKILKALFFRNVSDKTNTLSFVSYVTRDEADAIPNLNTSALDKKLKQLGAKTESLEQEIPF